jgi:hypothetical protein
MPWPQNSRTTEAVAFGEFLDRVADVAQARAGAHLHDASHMAS